MVPKFFQNFWRLFRACFAKYKNKGQTKAKKG